MNNREMVRTSHPTFSVALKSSVGCAVRTTISLDIPMTCCSGEGLDRMCLKTV